MGEDKKGWNMSLEREFQLQQEVKSLRQQLAEVADKVREECAQVCEGVVCGSQGMAGPSRCILKPGHDGPHSYGVPMAKTQRECAAAIRATKERP